MAERFLLGLGDADGFLIDEENVVGRAKDGLIFANRDAGASTEVDLLGQLNDPVSQLELRIDVVAGFLFRVLVFGHSRNCRRLWLTLCE